MSQQQGILTQMFRREWCCDLLDMQRQNKGTHVQTDKELRFGKGEKADTRAIQKRLKLPGECARSIRGRWIAGVPEL